MKGEEVLIPCHLCHKPFHTVELNSFGYGKEAVMMCKECGKKVFQFISKSAIETLERIYDDCNRGS